MDRPQSFENHRRLVPSFHGFVFFVLLINVVWSLWQVVKALGAANNRVGSIIGALVAIALFRLFFHVRTFAKTNQDRIIRHEMRTRLERILPNDLKSRIPSFTLDQLIALRFASDGELPALARKVLDEKLENRNQIKQMIKSWQADWLRV